MTSIRAALSLRAGARVNRSTLLRNLLSRLADILHLVVRQAATARIPSTDAPRKRSSRTSFGAIMNRPRPSLVSERRAAEKSTLRTERSFFNGLFGGKGFLGLLRSASHITDASDTSADRSTRRRVRADFSQSKRVPGRMDSTDDLHSLASGAFSTIGSYPGSMFSSVTELGGPHGPRPTRSGRRQGAAVKRDAATAMYIFERLLAKRTNPDLEDRIEVISTMADIAQVTFSGHYANSHKIEQVEEYSDTMAEVFKKHGQKIYAVVLDILFRPVREADANRIGVFSFHDTGIIDFGMEAPFTRRKLAQFPQSAICLPNMDCTGLAAVSCNSLLKVFLRFVPEVCAQRMALLTGTINSAFLHSSEALQLSPDGGCSWEVSKVVSAVDALTVLVSVLPDSVDAALELIIHEPVTLRLVIETCIRSVSATGRLLAQNAARTSAPRLSDEGTLDSLRSWQALIKIVPGTSSWAGTPSYSSSILFLGQVARRAALISVLQRYRKDRFPARAADDNTSDDTYPTLSTLNSSQSETNSISIDGSAGSGPPSFGGNGVGFEMEEENILTSELHQCVIAMITVPGTHPVDVFFELYRTLVYLYANDLKKSHNRMGRKVPSTANPKDIPKERSQERKNVSSRCDDNTREDILRDRLLNGKIGAPGQDIRTQSDEEAKGVLVENIAVDGQLPSRALRRAVMSSELDLGEYFDGGQPPSLQHISSSHTGSPAGTHTFEEFSHALAIVLGTLSNKSITDNFEDPQEAANLIARDVQRSGSSYLKRVHKRAKSILRQDMMNQDFDWRAVQYEQRIRKLEEEVASLKSMVQHSIEESVYLARRKSLPKILGLSGEGGTGRHGYGRDSGHDSMCGPAGCFCAN